MPRDLDPGFRGRDAQMQVIHDAVDEAASGRLTSVVVDGEAGIGKSRLLSEALHLAQDRRWQVVAGRAEELEQSRPFGVLVDAFACRTSSGEPRRSALGALLAGQTSARGITTVTSDPGLQFQVVDGLVDLVEAEALSQPLVIGIDDLQWADSSTLLTVAALVRRLPYVPMVIIVCLRPAPRTAEVGRVIDTLLAAGDRRLLLDELGEQDVAGLVAEIVGADPNPELLTKVWAAGGNPLFVTEFVRALVEEEAIKIVDGRAEVAQMVLPPTLQLTILRRLGFLPRDTVDVLRSASVLGSSFTVNDLSTVTGRSVFDLSSVLDSAFRGNVLTDDGNRVRFRHDLVRDAVYADLPRSMRVGLHREAGHRLADAGAPALRVAEHLVRSAEPGDAGAVAWLARAARETARTAPSIAADLLQRAIELVDPSDADGNALRLERAGFLTWAGQLPDAEAACRSLLEKPLDPAMDTSARTYLGRSLLAQGRMHEALRELELVVASPAAADAQLAESQGWASIAQLSLGEVDRAVTTAERARGAAMRAGDDATASLALTALGGVDELRANFGDALDLIDEGVRLADSTPQWLGHRYPHHLDRGHVLMELDRFAEVRASVETGKRLSEELGMRWQLAAYETVHAAERFLAGEWNEAMDAFEAGRALAEEETGVLGTLVLSHSVTSLIAFHRNDLERAEAAVSAALAARAAEDSYARYRGHWAAKAQALLLEADGAVGEAFTALADSWDRCAAAGLAVEFPVLGPDLVRLALLAGDRTRADQVTRAVAAVAEHNHVSSLIGAALLCQGLRDDDPAALRGAVDAYARSPRPLELGLACEEAGMALGRAGDADAAVGLLDRALKSFHHLDAARDTARVRAALRGLGVHRGRRGPRRRPQVGWDSLTTTERTVADLVAEGLSNPQIGERMFVSRRTVQTHLAHIFQKLQLSSRTELASAVTRQRERV